MASPNRSLRRSATLATVVVIILALAGCRSSDGWFQLPTRVAPPGTPPVASSPVGVVRALEWAFNHRDTLVYRTLFTADYRFRFAQADSTGNLYAFRSLTRAEELRFARAAFVLGTPHEPPPVAIALQFSGDIFALADSRSGKHWPWHREVAAQTLLRLEQPDFLVAGVSRFFVVRGDSAAWPEGLAHTVPDSTRWFIEEWDDETIGLITASVRSAPRVLPRDRTQPGSNPSFGRIKSLWLF